MARGVNQANTPHPNKQNKKIPISPRSTLNARSGRPLQRRRSPDPRNCVIVSSGCVFIGDPQRDRVIMAPAGCPMCSRPAPRDAHAPCHYLPFFGSVPNVGPVLLAWNLGPVVPPVPPSETVTVVELDTS